MSNKVLFSYEKWFFYLLLALWLTPVWTVGFIVTGDGPCHLYNSRLLLDWMQGNDVDMYRYFMVPNPHLDPNWLTNLIQVPLLLFFDPAIAEKIFYTIYVLGFAFGFRMLIKQINPNSLFISSVGLLFIWHHIVFKGFSNNTLSIAVWFWIVAVWMQHRGSPIWKAVLYQMILGLIGYLAHPMGFIYSGLMIACILVGDTVFHSRKSGLKAGIAYFKKHIFRLVLAYIPSLILMIKFIMRRSWSGEGSGYNNEVWTNLITMPALVDFHGKEEVLAISVSVGCIILLLYAILNKLKLRTLKKNDGVFLFFAVTLYTIIFPPSSMLGGLDVPRRLTMLPFIAILFCVAMQSWNKKFQVTALILTTIISLSFLFIRLPIQWQVSKYVQEIVSCKDSIAPRSTMLTLNYDVTPRNIAGDEIINREWINVHSDAYIGAYKPLVLGNNYELNFDYFPFLGKGETNFYFHSSIDGIIFESQPPRADFQGYKDKTGIQIDYVMVTGLDEIYRDHEYTKEIMLQLNRDYDKVYTSPNGIAVLYRHKLGFTNQWEK